jgi:hypothetical protein
MKLRDHYSLLLKDPSFGPSAKSRFLEWSKGGNFFNDIKPLGYYLININSLKPPNPNGVKLITECKDPLLKAMMKNYYSSSVNWWTQWTRGYCFDANSEGYLMVNLSKVPTPWRISLIESINLKEGADVIQTLYNLKSSWCIDWVSKKSILKIKQIPEALLPYWVAPVDAALGGPTEEVLVKQLENRSRLDKARTDARISLVLSNFYNEITDYK